MSNLNKICDIKIANARKKAIILIKEFEGCKLKAYICPANVWTIGYGNTNYLKSFVDPAKIGITQEKALSLLEDDVDVYFDYVVRQVGNICNENQIASLTSFAFNLGNDNANCTKLDLATVVAFEFGAACYEMPGEDADKRDYNVSSKKLYDLGFECQDSLLAVIKQNKAWLEQNEVKPWMRNV